MAEDSAPGGPDLAAGIAFRDLVDGRPLAGHVGDDPVVLVRRGDAVHALGGACTHYGGPLGEGLVIEGTIRCPWHHACFDVATGEALRAPALKPVDTWEVVREGDRVRVAAKRPAREGAPGAEPKRPPRIAGAPPRSIAIVGAGAAGEAACEMLRREGYDGPVTVFGAERTPPVDRPNLSKDFLAGHAPEDWIPLRSPDFFADIGVELRTSTRVRSIDPRAHTLALENGDEHEWDRLLLATGADPVRLDVPGGDGPDVYLLRTLADCRAIIEAAGRAAAAGGGRAVVVGSGFIGMEAAAALRSRGLEVHVVGREGEPLAHVLGADIAAYLRGVHERNGVLFHLGRQVRAFHRRAAELDDGTRLEADLFVVGVGVRPNVALAREAGLAVGNGIECDAYLETTAPGVFAAGDAASWPDPHTGDRVRVEHWVVAQRLGQLAARNLLGAREPCTLVPFFWTQHFDALVCYVGHARHWDRIDLDGSFESGEVTARFRRGAQTLAVVTIGRDLQSLEAEAAIERDDEGGLEALLAPRP